MARSHHSDSYILLTGATGLLGRSLVRDLAAAGRRVAVVVRPGKTADAAARVDELLRDWQEVAGVHVACPVVLEGNLSAEGLGLSAEQRDWVSANVGEVVHSAASLVFGRRETDGCGSSAHKQTVTGFKLQRLEKRAVRRLQHLRNRANDGPVQVGFKGLCVRSLDTGVLCVPAIEIAPHTAHGCRHFLALLELAARTFGNNSGGLDAQNARELDTGRMALPGEHLGTVEPECFDADEDLVVLGVWDGEGFDLEHLRATGLVDDGCFH